MCSAHTDMDGWMDGFFGQNSDDDLEETLMYMYMCDHSTPSTLTTSSSMSTCLKMVPITVYTRHM